MYKRTAPATAAEHSPEVSKLNVPSAITQRHAEQLVDRTRSKQTVRLRGVRQPVFGIGVVAMSARGQEDCKAEVGRKHNRRRTRLQSNGTKSHNPDTTKRSENDTVSQRNLTETHHRGFKEDCERGAQSAPYACNNPPQFQCQQVPKAHPSKPREVF